MVASRRPSFSDLLVCYTSFHPPYKSVLTEPCVIGRLPEDKSAHRHVCQAARTKNPSGQGSEGHKSLRFDGNPAVLTSLGSLRPVALRPHLSVGLPLASLPIQLSCKRSIYSGAVEALDRALLRRNERGEEGFILDPRYSYCQLH